MAAEKRRELVELREELLRALAGADSCRADQLREGIAWCNARLAGGVGGGR